jgi:23S rRNA (adenine2503-C2)-methyltransferase
MSLHDAHSIEAVYIPEDKRNTVCLSSQVGCNLGCTFCLTAHMGFIRNLLPFEIVSQFYVIKKELQLSRISNIVFMGMGEPLLNHKNVIRAIKILTSDFGQGVASRRITVSTAGVVKNIEPLLTETKVNLALSLNATEDLKRTSIMPINKKYSIKTLIETLEMLPIPKRRRVTIEYVLIRDVNDSPADAKRLVKLLSRVRAKVNLIPYNENPYIAMHAPDRKRIDEFQKYLIEKNITTMIRKQRGLDILGACGQLRVMEEN